MSACAFFALALALSLPAQQERWEELNARVGELYQQGQYARAVRVAQEALRVAEAIFGPEDPRTANSLNTLAFLYYQQGDYARAEPFGNFLRRACQRQEA